ncbi:MAG TPA: hypothetical protein VGD58_32305 [Herpetosiphonaceae bacterium]
MPTTPEVVAEDETSWPYDIVNGPDGAIWFTGEDTIGRLQFPVFYQYLPLAQS